MSHPAATLHSETELRHLAKQLHRHADLIDTKDLDLGRHNNPILQAAEGMDQLLDRLQLRRRIEGDDPLCDHCAAWEQEAFEANSKLQAVIDARDKALQALEAIRILAQRGRHEVWGKRVMRLCGEGGAGDPYLKASAR